MNPATVALLAENFVFLAAIAAGYLLLRQGGGLQVKAPPVPKKTPVPADDSAALQPIATVRRTGT